MTGVSPYDGSRTTTARGTDVTSDRAERTRRREPDRRPRRAGALRRLRRARGRARAVVLVHGLGGSHLNWDLLAPLLRPPRPGAGARPARVRAQRARRAPGVRARPTSRSLHRFLTEVAGEPAVLVGNSMGGMISILDGRRAPEAVTGLVLLDPAVPGPRRAPDPLVAPSSRSTRSRSWGSGSCGCAGAADTAAPRPRDCCGSAGSTPTRSRGGDRPVGHPARGAARTSRGWTRPSSRLPARCCGCSPTRAATARRWRRSPRRC